MKFDDVEVYKTIVQVCDKYAVSPSSSIESEDFFRKLCSEYHGRADLDSFAEWLGARVPEAFPSVGDRPNWIQEAQWPFANARPMTFVGQIDVPASRAQGLEGIYHDDASIYVFVARQSKPAVVEQQY